MGHQDEGDDRADGAVLVLEGAPPLRVHREPDAHPGHCRGQDKEDAGRPAGPVPGQPRQRNRPRGNQPGCLPATGVGEGVAATVPEQKVLPLPFLVTPLSSRHAAHRRLRPRDRLGPGRQTAAGEVDAGPPEGGPDARIAGAQSRAGHAKDTGSRALRQVAPPRGLVPGLRRARHGRPASGHRRRRREGRRGGAARGRVAREFGRPAGAARAACAWALEHPDAAP